MTRTVPVPDFFQAILEGHHVACWPGGQVTENECVIDCGFLGFEFRQQRTFESANSRFVNSAGVMCDKPR
jgi:hypothetical protein